MTPFVVFNTSTGEALQWGTCQDDMVEAQAGAGETALATSSLTAEGNRAALWEVVKVHRTARIDGGAATPWGMVQTDTLSRSNISGAVLAALIAKSASQPFAITWTFADNSTAALGADEMIGLGSMVMAHVDACYAAARTLRSAIDRAADMAALLAIDLAAGWPLSETED
jgi:hypothetical protein